MRAINFYLQLVALLSVLVALFMAIFERESLMYIVTMQFFIGAYQYLTGSYLMLCKTTSSIRKYWQSSTALLVVIFIIFNANLGPGFEVPFIVIVFILPWLLALYFLYISFQLYKSPSK